MRLYDMTTPYSDIRTDKHTLLHSLLVKYIICISRLDTKKWSECCFTQLIILLSLEKCLTTNNPYLLSCITVIVCTGSVIGRLLSVMIALSAHRYLLGAAISMHCTAQYSRGKKCFWEMVKLIVTADFLLEGR